MQNLEVTKVAFLEDYFIEISLREGHRIVYNLKPKLKTMRFRELEESEIFFKGKLVNGNRIRWTGNIEISLEEMLAQVAEQTNYKTMNMTANEKGKTI